MGNELQTLTLTIQRQVQPTEVTDLVFGTGIFGYPWWLDGGVVRPRSDGHGFKKIKAEYIQPGDLIRMVHWEKDTESGRVVTDVTLQQVCDAVFNARQHIAHESWRDMTAEELGLADAEAADVVMQWAVFGGEIVYG